MYLIRVSTSSNLGKGHISRCIKIRNRIKNKVVWFVDRGSKKNLEKIIKDKIVEENSKASLLKITKYLKDYNVEAIIIDNPEIKNLRKQNIFGDSPIIIFVDKYVSIKNVLSVCMHPINIKEDNFISGHKYLPLIKKNQKINKNKKIKNILVSFGSRDSKCLTEKVIKAFQEMMVHRDYKLSEYKINIILGKYKKNIKIIKRSVSFNKNFQIFNNLISLNSLYEKSDFAIGAPGFSQIERLEYNIPTILIAQNGTQKKLLESWEGIGCALIVKNIQKDLKNNIDLMIQKNEVKKNIKKMILKKFDNKGSLRVLKKIENYVRDFKSN